MHSGTKKIQTCENKQIELKQKKQSSLVEKKGKTKVRKETFWSIRSRICEKKVWLFQKIFKLSGHFEKCDFGGSQTLVVLHPFVKS